MNLKLLRLYAQIPEFKCKPGCTDCCGWTCWSKSEWEAVKDKRKATGIYCPYANGGCDIYDQRPFMCRLFGAADHRFLKCPHGCGPKKPLTKKKARELTNLYQNMMGD